MASTLNLQSTINFIKGFVRMQPLLIGGFEPALSICNTILQTMLGPPFCWRWNRNTVNFSCNVAGAQDYMVGAINDLGFLEKAWLTAPSGEIKEMEIRNTLAQAVNQDRPKYIAAQNDDGAGNIQFRLMPVPDQNYIASVSYQKKAPLLSSLANLWFPVPDELSYIFNYGVLALALAFVNDPRFPIFNRNFVGHLLGAQEGLDDMQRNLFLGNWLEVTKAATRADLGTRQGIGARGQ